MTVERILLLHGLIFLFFFWLLQRKVSVRQVMQNWKMCRIRHILLKKCIEYAAYKEWTNRYNVGSSGEELVKKRNNLRDMKGGKDQTLFWERDLVSKKRIST